MAIGEGLYIQPDIENMARYSRKETVAILGVL